MQVSPTWKYDLTNIGTLSLSHIAGLTVRSFKGKRLVRRTASTIQLGWGTKLAHCCRATFDAVKIAHASHLGSIGNSDLLRHPLYYAKRSSGQPPYRLDQAIHLITRIRAQSPRAASWRNRANPRGCSRDSALRPACCYQHHSERRTLVLLDHLVR